MTRPVSLRELRECAGDVLHLCDLWEEDGIVELDANHPGLELLTSMIELTSAQVVGLTAQRAAAIAENDEATDTPNVAVARPLSAAAAWLGAGPPQDPPPSPDQPLEPASSTSAVGAGAAVSQSNTATAHAGVSRVEATPTASPAAGAAPPPAAATTSPASGSAAAPANATSSSSTGSAAAPPVAARAAATSTSRASSSSGPAPPPAPEAGAARGPAAPQAVPPPPPPPPPQAAPAQGGGRVVPQERLDRAEKAGQQAALKLAGTIRFVTESPPIDERPSYYVVLRSSVDTAAVFRRWKTSGHGLGARNATCDLEGRIRPACVFHAFPSLIEARTYCHAAGRPYPIQHP